MTDNILEIQELISLTEKHQEKFVIIFINGDKKYTEANSGYLEKKEAEEIIKSFEMTSECFYFYNNPSTFVGDIVLNKFLHYKNKFIFLYSAAQIGVDVNRRSFIPNFAQLHNIFNLTCDSYSLSLLQNKAHYYELAKNYVNVPKTFLFNGKDHSVFEQLTNRRYILKPNIECSARGVKDIIYSNGSKSTVIDLYLEFVQPILIQEFKAGIEVEVPVIVKNGKALALHPIRINKKHEILSQEEVDYEKYSFEILSNEYNIQNIQRSAEKVITTLQSQGLCRVDFIIDEFGEPWLFDIAAIPLITEHSSCYTSFAHSFPNNKHALYKALIGAKLIQLI